jgi:hypothetical protein
LVKAATVQAGQLFAGLLVLRAAAVHPAQAARVQMVEHTAAAAREQAQVLALAQVLLARFALFGRVTHARTHQLVQATNHEPLY